MHCRKRALTQLLLELIIVDIPGQKVELETFVASRGVHADLGLVDAAFIVCR